MAGRTEPWADIDSGSRFHEPQEPEREEDPDRIYERQMEESLE